MRNRKIQRKLERMGIRSLDARDACGVVDLVARDAVERWKREVVRAERLRMRSEKGRVS